MEKMDMSEEKKPQTKILLPEGWRKFKIVGCDERTSKAGNKMFVISARDVETGYDDTWFAIAEPKKRWFLKAILDACGCPIEDGVYTWDVNTIMQKNVSGLVVHEDNEYINRDGETVKTKQHKVVDLQQVEQDEPKKEMTDEERQKAIENNTLAWDD